MGMIWVGTVCNVSQNNGEMLRSWLLKEKAANQNDENLLFYFFACWEIFLWLCCRLLTFFKRFFQDTIRVSKGFGSCRSWSVSKLFVKVTSRWHKSRKELFSLIKIDTYNFLTQKSFYGRGNYSCLWHVQCHLKVIVHYSVSLALSLCLPVSSAVNICKQYGPRSGATKHRAWSGSILFDTLMVFQKEFFEKK